MRPRKLELPNLIQQLVREHEEMKSIMKKAKHFLEKGEPRRAAELLENFRPLLDQHIIDEEASVLKILLDVYGEATSAIQVFQQHRDIHWLVNEVIESMMGGLGRVGELIEGLDRLFAEHFKAEETQVFPQALKAREKLRKNP